MKIMKTLQKINELNAREEERERTELARREDLLRRLNISRNNNTKLFAINPKGEIFVK
jgi:hypothetical protein